MIPISLIFIDYQGKTVCGGLYLILISLFANPEKQSLNFGQPLSLSGGDLLLTLDV